MYGPRLEPCGVLLLIVQICYSSVMSSRVLTIASGAVFSRCFRGFTKPGIMGAGPRWLMILKQTTTDSGPLFQ